MVSTGRGDHVVSSLAMTDTAGPAPSRVAAAVSGEVVEPAGGAGRVARVRKDHLEDIRTDVMEGAR
jgi:hypothetical protein